MRVQQVKPGKRVRKRVTSLVAVLAAVLAMLGVVSASQGRALANTWSGTWSTEWGEMTLIQYGSQLEGTYPHDAGHVAGTVDGNNFQGRWDEAPTRKGPTDAGAVEFTLGADGKTLTGRWHMTARRRHGTPTGADAARRAAASRTPRPSPSRSRASSIATTGLDRELKHRCQADPTAPPASLPSRSRPPASSRRRSQTGLSRFGSDRLTRPSSSIRWKPAGSRLPEERVRLRLPGRDEGDPHRREHTCLSVLVMWSGLPARPRRCPHVSGG